MEFPYFFLDEKTIAPLEETNTSVLRESSFRQLFFPDRGQAQGMKSKGAILSTEKFNQKLRKQPPTRMTMPKNGCKEGAKKSPIQWKIGRRQWWKRNCSLRMEKVGDEMQPEHYIACRRHIWRLRQGFRLPSCLGPLPLVVKNSWIIKKSNNWSYRVFP